VRLGCPTHAATLSYASLARCGPTLLHNLTSAHTLPDCGAGTWPAFAAAAFAERLAGAVTFDLGRHHLSERCAHDRADGPLILPIGQCSQQWRYEHPDERHTRIRITPPPNERRGTPQPFRRKSPWNPRRFDERVSNDKCRINQFLAGVPPRPNRRGRG